MESKVKSARIHKMIQFYHSNEHIQTIFIETKSVLCTAKCLIVTDSSLSVLEIYLQTCSPMFFRFYKLNKEGIELSKPFYLILLQTASFFVGIKIILGRKYILIKDSRC